MSCTDTERQVQPGGYDDGDAVPVVVGRSRKALAADIGAARAVGIVSESKIVAALLDHLPRLRGEPWSASGMADATEDHVVVAVAAGMRKVVTG